MDKKNIELKTKDFFHRYFHFFSIPDFVPHKWLKKLWHKWLHIFTKREELGVLKEEKDSNLEDLNINGILDAIEDIIKNVNEEASNIRDIIDNFNNENIDLNNSVNNFEKMLKGIITEQNDYNWYGG